MLTNQIGDTSIRIIEHEIKRYKVRVNEFRVKAELAEQAVAQGNPQAAEMQDAIRKEEKKLGTMVKK